MESVGGVGCLWIPPDHPLAVKGLWFDGDKSGDKSLLMWGHFLFCFVLTT